MNVRIEIAGDRVIYKQDGKEALSASLADVLTRVIHNSDAVCLPNGEAIPGGVVFIRRRGDAVVLVMEEKPQPRTVRWLSDESPAPFGRGATYRTARLAFPFVVVIVGLYGGSLTGYQQCYYRTVPLRSMSDPLLFTNLYNVADGHGQVSWLCLANMTKPLAPLACEDKVREIRRHLWGAGFNRSSEVYEGNSYWGRMRVDPRVKTLAAWEEATRADPSFPLSVEWKPAGVTVGHVVEQILSILAPYKLPATATELVLMLMPPARPSARTKMILPLELSDSV